MRRNLDQRLRKLEARFVSPVKARDITIRFLAPDGSIESKLYYREGWWIPPESSLPETFDEDVKASKIHCNER
jgi:hypothetical protein